MPEPHTYLRPLRFYTPLVDAEKAGLLESVSREWGCDDPTVLAHCLHVVEMKRIREVLLALRRGLLKCECGNDRFRLKDEHGPKIASGAGVPLVCTVCGKTTSTPR